MSKASHLRILQVRFRAKHACDRWHFSVLTNTFFATLQPLSPSRCPADRRTAECIRWSRSSIVWLSVAVVPRCQWTVDTNCHPKSVYPTNEWFYAVETHLYWLKEKSKIHSVDQRSFSGVLNLRENIVRNQGIAKSSGMKLISFKWFDKTGSWNAVNCENLLRYSLIIAELSFRKNQCKYFGMNLYKLKKARSGNKWLNLIGLNNSIFTAVTFVIEIQVEKRRR